MHEGAEAPLSLRKDTMKNIMALLLIPLAITGCTSTYNTEKLMAPSGKLQRQHAVAIHVPADGKYGSTAQPRSGQLTAEALKKGFGAYSSDVKFVPTGKSRTDFSGIANIYYVEPEVMHWEERATEWSGKPDRIRIKIDVYETSSMSHLSSIIFTGKSKWATFGGDHPQDLLPKPIEEYLKILY
jgi:hypothetical protein